MCLSTGLEFQVSMEPPRGILKRKRSVDAAESAAGAADVVAGAAPPRRMACGA